VGRKTNRNRRSETGPRPPSPTSSKAERLPGRPLYRNSSRARPVHRTGTGDRSETRSSTPIVLRRLTPAWDAHKGTPNPQDESPVARDRGRRP
jgi:hypothetical protein